ncbi:hypothetical protein KHQ82_05320 [Mycoplasmatota bacterium]|nr:hypothetical protein KHQ82_05320 [Mycoplasmatota bacterium]
MKVKYVIETKKITTCKDCFFNTIELGQFVDVHSCGLNEFINTEFHSVKLNKPPHCPLVRFNDISTDGVIAVHGSVDNCEEGYSGKDSK